MGPPPPPGVMPTIAGQSLAEVWNDLKDGIERIYKMENLRKKRYMDLYSHVYNYCTSVDPQVSVAQRQNIHIVPSPSVSRNRRNTNEPSGRTVNSPGAKFVGHELYKKLKDYLKAHVANVKQQGKGLNGVEMLDFFQRSWEHYRFSSKVLHGVCAYLNRNWIKREIDEGHKGIYQIYSVSFIICNFTCPLSFSIFS